MSYGKKTTSPETDNPVAPADPEILSVRMKEAIRSAGNFAAVGDKASAIVTGRFDGIPGVYITFKHGRVFVPHSNLAEITVK